MATQNFGKTEQRLAQILGHFPGLKQRIKKAYQTVNFHLNKKKDPFQCELPLTRIGSHPNGEFFGYFQNSPERNRNVAYLVPSFKTLKYKRCFPVDICINGEKIAETTAWNWQQGCMLWWLNNEEICHNAFNGHVYQARIVNRVSHKYRLLDLPLCAISPDGTLGYSIDFKNLAILNPDYGYFCHPRQNLDIKTATIYAINIHENRILAEMNLDTILATSPLPSFHNARHEINHIMVSPDGQKIMFIHRWQQPRKSRQSRLIIANHNLTKPFCVMDCTMASHCTWKNSSQIIGWMQFDNAPAYYSINCENEREIIGKDILRTDGHPTVIENKWLLTDTYPDRARMSHLLLYHLDTGHLIKLGEFFSPLKFWGDTRCDLHPKYSSESKSVFFESTHTGQRCLYQMKLDHLINALAR